MAKYYLHSEFDKKRLIKINLKVPQLYDLNKNYEAANHIRSLISYTSSPVIYKKIYYQL